MKRSPWDHEDSEAITCFLNASVQVDVEKKESDEEPMEMVVEKPYETDLEPDPVAEAETETKNSLVLLDKMVEELKPMDTDREVLVPESKSPEEDIDMAPMQTDEQFKQVRCLCVCQSWVQIHVYLIDYLLFKFLCSVYLSIFNDYFQMMWP